MKLNKSSSSFILLAALLFLLSGSDSFTKNKKPLTFSDVMKFRTIHNTVISDDGKFVAFTSVPDRGDPDIVVQSTDADSLKFNIKRANKPVISSSGEWVVFTIPPKAVDYENADKDNKPKNGMGILNTSTGKIVKFDNVEKFSLSDDSKWLAYKLCDMNPAKPGVEKIKTKGTNMFLHHLQSGSELTFPGVTEFAFDSMSKFLAYTVSEDSSKKNGVYIIDLMGNFFFPVKASAVDSELYSNIEWSTKTASLAFISAKKKNDGSPDSCSLNVWDFLTKTTSVLLPSDSLPKDRVIPFINSLRWSNDCRRLFFGLKPANDTIPKKSEIKFNDTSFYDIDTILKKTQLDVWHWNDPRIKTNQKKWWEGHKDSTYLSVYNFDTKSYVQLADDILPDVAFSQNPSYTIGYNGKPYLLESTWEGEGAKDLYSVNLRSGTRKLITRKIRENAYISPTGRYVLYFQKKVWYLYDNTLDTTVNLTGEAKANFYNEDFDEPAEPPSYGIAGWMENDNAVLIYDKYDIWRFFTTMGFSYVNQTAADGRMYKLIFRAVNLDPDREYYKTSETLWVQGFSEKEKYQGIYRVTFDMLGPEQMILENCKINFAVKAKNSDKMLFTKEKYDMFPDLWVTDSLNKSPKKLTDYNSQTENYLWGKAELVSWKSDEGDSLQGYIIKPDDYDPAKRYPVLVYFYEKFSDYFNVFITPRINHRPCYPLYSGDGYVIFIPDIKYKTGFPGFNAVDCIIPGVRKLIEEGIADSTAIGIQGHSWGGYQAAFIVTQTNMFAAAVAGAPVGNMTSSYNEIRLESGLAREFQYEHEQSRIGGNLWDSLNNYINNSPVFQAKKIETPLLIMFGDVDNAVPWQQGIELYLSLRRLNKECIMLQYRNEPHLPQKYEDKLDYAIRMKQFFDTYLKKKTAPSWIIKGIEYNGR
jgi:acetyl esterase/lipase